MGIESNKIVKNASWIIACRIIQSFLTLLVGVFTARYLGPANFGLISYAGSVVAFVTPVMYLGINSIIVQELVDKPNKEGETLGTSVLLCVISAVMCVLGITAFSIFTNYGSSETILICSLYSLLLVFRAFDLIQYWFQAHLISKYQSVVALISYAIASGYKIYLLATGKSVVWFSLSNSIDVFLSAALLTFIYHRLKGPKFRFSWNHGKEMLRRGRPFIVSSMMITIFTQTDKIMLKNMLGDISTGFYSAASVCSLITSFVFTAIFDSMRPSVLESKKYQSTEIYENKIKTLFSIVTLLSIAQCLFFIVGSPLVVNVLYGSEYSSSISILRILAASPIFSYIGMTRSIWILAESKQKYLWKINLLGALSNVILNLILIPLKGAEGAAIATVITQAITNIGVGCIIKPIRRSNTLLFQSLSPKFIITVLSSLMKGLKND